MNNGPLLFVTGSTGCVGSWVVFEGLKRGFRVRALCRDKQGAQKLLGKRDDLEFVVGDFCDPRIIAPSLRDVTWVVHCAAAVGHDQSNKYQDTNVDAMQRWLNGARRISGLERWIHLSSLGVYPLGDHHGTDEKQPLGKGGIDLYTNSKIKGEQLFRDHYKDLPYVILRPGFIYGPRDRQVLPRVIKRLRQKRMVYVDGGRRIMNNTFVGNLSAAIFAALEQPAALRQTYNITDQELVDRRRFLAAITAHLNLEPPQLSLPRPVMRLMIMLFGGGKRGRRAADPLLSPATLKFLGYDLQYSIAKAEQELGYRAPFGFDEAMAETLEYFQATIPQPLANPAPISAARRPL